MKCHCSLWVATGLLLIPIAASTQQAEDVATIDGIVKAFYEVVSGPTGESADRARDEFIHHPDAAVAIASVDADGNRVLTTMTLGEYHDRFGGPRAQPFYEWEIHRVTQHFGSIAQVWTTYVESDAPNGSPNGRGINSIQLYFDGDRWWITSWVFDSERAGNEIPEEYVPGR